MAASAQVLASVHSLQILSHTAAENEPRPAPGSSNRICLGNWEKRLAMKRPTAGGVNTWPFSWRCAIDVAASCRRWSAEENGRWSRPLWSCWRMISVTSRGHVDTVLSYTKVRNYFEVGQSKMQVHPLTHLASHDAVFDRVPGLTTLRSRLTACHVGKERGQLRDKLQTPPAHLRSWNTTRRAATMIPLARAGLIGYPSALSASCQALR